MANEEFNKLILQAEKVRQLQEQMALTLQPLYNDADFALNEWLKDKSNQFWRRTLIRCILVVIESVIWNMKNMLPEIAEISEVTFTIPELEIITERTVVEKNGKKKGDNNFIRFRKNLKATFQLFAKVHGAAYSIKNAHDFDALCDTYKLRNRLMHPKVPSDPPVSNDEIRTSQRGLAWLGNEHNRLIEMCAESVAKKAKGET